MAAIVLAGSVLAWLMGLAVGARLLRIAARTHQTPELAIGLSYVLTAGFGFPPLILASQLRASQPDLGQMLLVFAQFPICAGLFATSLGAWRIFRPAARWPGVLIALIWGSTATFVGRAILAEDYLDFRVESWNAILAGTLGWVWMSVESFLLWSKLRKRARFGLASPEVTNRVLLWGVSSVAAIVSSAMGRIQIEIADLDVKSFVALAHSADLWACAIAMWLAFFPPVAYRRRVAAQRNLAAQGGT